MTTMSSISQALQYRRTPPVRRMRQRSPHPSAGPASAARLPADASAKAGTASVNPESIGGGLDCERDARSGGAAALTS
jgi:hypothetical protein